MIVPKRCPSCKKGVEVDTTKDQDICVNCGEIYIITHTLGSNEKTGNVHGIRLKAIRKFKVCSHCHIEKPVEMFNKYVASPDGYNPRCRKCASEANKQYMKDKRKYKYIQQVEVPACAPRMRLSDVFPSLVKISSGHCKYVDTILKNTIEGIKEEIS